MAHLCTGHCGRLVSSNKAKCLRCLWKEAKANLEARGFEVDEDEVKRLMRVHATGA